MGAASIFCFCTFLRGSGLVEDGTPDGQLEIWLEGCQDSGLTHIDVEYSSIITARWVYTSGDYYSFTVSAGSDGPVFAWHEVTLGDYYKWETTPGTFETFRLNERGLSQGLAELLAMDDSHSVVPGYWRELATSLIGLHMAAEGYMLESTSQVENGFTAGLSPEDRQDDDLMDTIGGEVSAAGHAAAEHLAGRFQQSAEAPPVFDVEECFRVFEAACAQRVVSCDAMRVAWDKDFGRPPSVEFGIAMNTPGQVRYQVDPDGALHLNGFRTALHSLEDDLLEQFPNDAWARLGARNAARDLLEIQRTARELMNAQQQDALQDMDRRHVERRLEAMLQGVPVNEDWRHSNLRTANWYCGKLQERIQTYLAGFQRWFPIPDDEYDFTGL